MLMFLHYICDIAFLMEMGVTQLILANQINCMEKSINCLKQKLEKSMDPARIIGK